jgi:hypothetical protein
MRASLPPPHVLLPHTCTQDGWFLQPKRRQARLPRRTVPSNCICRCSRMRVANVAFPPCPTHFLIKLPRCRIIEERLHSELLIATLIPPLPILVCSNSCLHPLYQLEHICPSLSSRICSTQTPFFHQDWLHLSGGLCCRCTGCNA